MMRRPSFRHFPRAALLAASLAVFLAAPAAAQVPFGGDSDQPVEVKADQAIELHQDIKAYVARGNASAKKGEVTVFADQLVAYYREAPGAGNQVYRLVADGNVHIVGTQQEVFGRRGVYDMDQKLLVITGDNLKLVTKTDVITARDSLEWYDDRQLAVARGEAEAIRGDSRMRADVLMGQFTKDANGQQVLNRIDGSGHVVLTNPRDVARADKLVYTLDNDTTVLIGNVRITRGDDHITGDAAEMNMTTKVSRVIGSGGRVTGLLIRGGENPSEPGKPAPPLPAESPSGTQ